jgi:hypothetical protein
MLALSACGTGIPDFYAQCNITVDLAPAEARVGDQVIATGGPFSDEYDTRLTINGVRAEIDLIERTDCDACDLCRVDSDCISCGTCTACTDVCATCVPTMTFTVPDAVPPGQVSLVVLNRYGGSRAVPFTVLDDGADTAPNDTAASDTSDTALSPTGDTATPGTTDTLDTSTRDTGTRDTGNTGGLHTGDTGSKTTTSPTGDTGALHTGDTSSGSST